MEFKTKLDEECGFHINKNDGFCAPKEIVEQIKEINGTVDADGEEVLEELKDNYGCETEVCVLNHGKIKHRIGDARIQEIINQYFKPVGPRDSNEWLSNTNIDQVLDQIQLQYPEKQFYHINFQMIDFEKMGSELAKLDWPKEYKKGYRSFGTVMNTDVSSGTGKHWMALYGDFSDDVDEFTIEYFNSSGELPMDEISAWMKKAKYLWQKHFNKPIKDIIVTRIENQQDDWNCGPYSLYYIISRLYGVDYKYFEHNKIGDANMQMFRKYLFRE